MKAIFVGDLHLGSLNKYFPNHPNPDDFIYEALEKVFSYAREENIKHIIYLGDIFDNPLPLPTSVIRFTKFNLKNLSKWKDLNLYLIPGNHDYEKQGDTSLRIPMYIKSLGVMDRFHIFSQPSKIKVEKIPFQFLPWPFHKRLEGSASVIVAHITLNGHVMNSGYKAKNKIEVEVGKDVWVVGDIHERCKVKKGFYHPGTLYQTRSDEKLPKGFTIMTASKLKSGKLKTNFKFMPIDPPHRLETKIIEVKEDFDNLTNQPNIAYKLFISEGIRIPSDLRSRFPNIWKIEGYKSKEDLKKVQNTPKWLEKFFQNETDSVKGKSLLTGLGPWLKSKGLKAKQIKIAKKIMKKEIQPLLSDG